VGVIDIEHGTPERAWSESMRLHALPDFATGDPARVFVIAPHPDDETLALGGTLSMLAKRAAIRVVALTEGEASHPASTIAKADLGALRARERELALSRLGLDQAELIRLDLGDGHLSERSDLADRLAPWIEGASYGFAPFREDGHPDHDAAGRAAASACRSCGIRLYEYPVWAWHWAHPDRNDLPWWRARRVALAPEAQVKKAYAVRAYRSQIAPLALAETVLPPAVLAHFARAFEVLFV
jgi:LmbE family N-acetylglucosaminyl deacetylase